jgi:hypothetical protein
MKFEDLSPEELSLLKRKGDRSPEEVTALNRKLLACVRPEDVPAVNEQLRVIMERIFTPEEIAEFTKMYEEERKSLEAN